jgi:hypothetical protein
MFAEADEFQLVEAQSSPRPRSSKKRKALLDDLSNSASAADMKFAKRVRSGNFSLVLVHFVGDSLPDANSFFDVDLASLASSNAEQLFAPGKPVLMLILTLQSQI